MDYSEICKEIELQNYNYISQHNLKPNNIILGASVYKMLKKSCDLMLGVDREYDKAYGMTITIDSTNPRVIKVGYMEISK